MDSVIGNARAQLYADLIRDSGTAPTEAELEAALVCMSWDNVRARRNELLAQTDFYALSDVVMSDAMKTYRQSLRDLPSSTENSVDVVWPEKPD